MIDKLFKTFGDTLPERHVFFASEGAPTRALLFKEFGSWVSFNNEYYRYVAVQKALAASKAKNVAVKAKGATNAK